ncbi:kinesin-domain-containing protein [Tilletiaria anomala UBC 951]|uniref:Kinesin-domain-containing protein n=1 Tax=Tilletiaria anomala (strain ATCC 24038 / CBS 436.72 / UBC 951) TaxID=1037660 RepID=A0A066W117_TILAU|nr:kinesin-domain-containing protein [Tilletiaria anomala UBC 951]KDN44759.1 kinesin-domain-containing protein [Tilletiaria anomala UBC 951]
MDPARSSEYTNGPMPVISAKMSGLQPFMPVPRHRTSSTKSLRNAASKDSFEASLFPSKVLGDPSFAESSDSGKELKVLDIYESLEDMPAPIPVARADESVRKSARVAQHEKSSLRLTTRTRPNLKSASPLKAALTSATPARVAPAPFNLSPSKAASPKVLAPPTSSMKGKCVLEDFEGPRPASPACTAAPIIRAKVTQGLSSRMTSRAGRGERVRPVSPLKESTRQGLGIQLEEARSSVVYEFEDNDLADSSFVYDVPRELGPGMASDEPVASNAQLEEQETVMVHVRLRPPKPQEECAWLTSPYESSITLAPAIAITRTQREVGHPHQFDGVHSGSSNAALYADVARPLVRAALAGYDAVVFAYGQTASGKTFTLSGDEQGQEAGIIPRAVRDVFRGIQQSESTREYLLRVSYLEIWNENVKDLLDPTNVPVVRDDRRKGAKGTLVKPLREEIVTSPAAVRDLLRRGQTNRHVGATDWNERSSRSHTCFKMTIESWQRCVDMSPGKGGRKVRISELSLIDLAGSEKYVSQGSDRRTEGAHINKSLLTLGKVILSLSESNATRSGNSAAPPQHIPYRDSKLTRILQNSLSGNARVAVVCTLNPSPNAVEESISTLNFAHRVKKVTLHAKRREIQESSMGTGGMGHEAQALLMRYKLEAESLRTQVQQMQSGDERLLEVQRRLDLLEMLKVRGGDRGKRGQPSLNDAESDEDVEELNHLPARPVSPMKGGSAFDFDEPSHLLREKLFTAEERIAQLEERLANQPQLSQEALSSDGQLKLIAELQRKVQELELVCEAQAADPPPKVREDVEREWQGKVDELQKKLDQREQFVAVLTRQCEELRQAKKQLWKLAHGKTADIFSTIHTPSSSPRPDQPVRPASVVGTVRIEPPSTSASPLLRKALADQQGRGKNRHPPPSLPSAAPDSPSLSTQRKRGRRSHSFSAVDHLQVMDQIAAMADTMLAASSTSEGNEDVPQRRSALNSGSDLKAEKLFLDVSMRDIHAEIATAARGRLVSGELK